MFGLTALGETERSHLQAVAKAAPFIDDRENDIRSLNFKNLFCAGINKSDINILFFLKFFPRALLRRQQGHVEQSHVWFGGFM